MVLICIVWTGIGQNLWMRIFWDNQWSYLWSIYVHTELWLHQFVVLAGNMWDCMSWYLKMFWANLCYMSWLDQFIPFAGHTLFCKLVTVLFLTFINQTLSEARQTGILDEVVCRDQPPRHWAEQERKKGEQMQKNQHTYRPACFSPFLPPFLPLLPHCLISQLRLILPYLCILLSFIHFTLWELWL